MFDVCQHPLPIVAFVCMCLALAVLPASPTLSLQHNDITNAYGRCTRQGTCVPHHTVPHHDKTFSTAAPGHEQSQIKPGKSDQPLTTRSSELQCVTRTMSKKQCALQVLRTPQGQEHCTRKPNPSLKRELFPDTAADQHHPRTPACCISTRAPPHSHALTHANTVADLPPLPGHSASAAAH